MEMRNQIREAFCQSYYSTRKTLAGYLVSLKGLILAHPTVTTRTIMRNAYIYPEAGLDSIETFACYPMRKDQYRIMPMNDTCTEYIPVTFTHLNSTHDAYLDLTMNSFESPARSCLRSNNRILICIINRIGRRVL